jgi:glycosyltransferase involved in cell wall biosynthesis
MKVALVYDWLNHKFGGGEQMLVELAKMYPDAPIYTLLYNQELCGDAIDHRRVRTSRLQKLPNWIKRRPRYLLPLIPTAIEQYDLSEYDVVISASSAFSKSVITRPETMHVSYCYSPTRMVWDAWPAYLNDQHVNPVTRGFIHLLSSRLRLWDFYSANRVDHWVAISETVAARIRKYYRKEVSAVIYPGADTQKYSTSKKKGDYFVTLSSLAPYKRIDLAIAACNKLGKQLIIIGYGSDKARLQQLAGPTIKLAGRIDDSARNKLLAEAKALIFPGEEDFGIAPIEAMASGTPVIAYGKGGLTETVIAGKTGLFFKEQTVDSLVQAINNFDQTSFAQDDLIAQAREYDISKFRHDFKKFIEDKYKAYVAAETV